MLKNLLDQVLDHLNPRREPVVYGAIGLAVLLTVYRVAVEGEPLGNFISANYWEGLLGVILSFLVRAGVYSPKTVEEREKAALDTGEHVPGTSE